MTIKAIIFDLDGTLIDSMGLWRQVDEEFLTSRLISVPADLFDNLPQGNSFIETARYFKERFSLNESTDEIMQIWTDMVAEHYQSTIFLKPLAKDLLIALKEKGLKLGLATSNSYHLAQTALKFNQVYELFSFFSTGDRQKHGKPFPHIFLDCAAGLGVKPFECIAIEDTLPGVMAAKAANMTTIAIYDEDSLPFHKEMEKLADSFCMDYIELKTEIYKRLI